jgi:alkylated DNA repair dioxygenase AlkB
MGQRKDNDANVPLGLVAQRTALQRLQNSRTACRDCGIAQPATVEYYHIRQLKAFIIRGETADSMVCLSCAQNAKLEEHRPPIGVQLDLASGCPQRSAGGDWQRCIKYWNDELQFPYLGREQRSEAEREGPEHARPSVWVTEPAALHDITGLRYYPNFLSADEQQQILDILDADSGGRWHKVFRRRQQFYGEVYYHTPHDEAAVQPAFGEQTNTAVGLIAPYPISPFSFLVDKFFDSFWECCSQEARSEGFVFGANRDGFPTQILVNEYLEDFGISSHFEDEDAFGSVIATISLLAPVYMQLEKPVEHNNQCRNLVGCTKVLLEPRSLFIMSEGCRFEWRHGITRQSVLHVPSASSNIASEIFVQGEGYPEDNRAPLVNEDGVRMDTVLRNANYRRISLTIRHLLPGRKQIRVGNSGQAHSSCDVDQHR